MLAKSWKKIGLIILIVACLWNIVGKLTKIISFDGKKQRIAGDDSFANPNSNLFELNRDGSLLAVSFADGSLTVFDLLNKNGAMDVLKPSDEYLHFDGGFFDKFFAFSVTGEEISTVSTFDTEKNTLTNWFEADSYYRVKADENGIYISIDNIVAQFDPENDDLWEFAYVHNDILSFDTSSQYTVVATKENGYTFFDRNAYELSNYTNTNSCDFISIAGDYALIGGRNGPLLNVLKLKSYPNKQIFAYDPSYEHSEARLNEDMTRVMLFSYKGIRLYDISGDMLNDIEIPEAEMVYDQQYGKKSGNLAVIYEDALRIYSGNNCSLLLEKTGLKSVFYAPYGISILDNDGTLSLIDIDTADVIVTEHAHGDYAVYCGMIADSFFLKGRELIGAAKTETGYVFAVSGGTHGSVYNDKGKKLFDIETGIRCEAFFTSEKVIISPLHGTPIVYDLRNGKFIKELDKDAYLTHVTQVGMDCVTQYVLATNGTRYGVMLDGTSCEVLAYLPSLCDITGTEAIFDLRGVLRKTSIYSADELINLAKERQASEIDIPTQTQ